MVPYLLVDLARRFFKLPFRLIPSEEPEPALASSTSFQSTGLGPFPLEIWRQVWAYVVILEGSRSTDLVDAFNPMFTSEHPGFMDHPSYSSFQRDLIALSLVHRLWAREIRRMSLEYLQISSVAQLEAIFVVLDAEPAAQLGQAVRRIDVVVSKLEEDGLIAHLVRLLSRTPQLRTFVHCVDSASAGVSTPSSVLRVLAEYCGPSLRRIEWGTLANAPQQQDLVKLLQCSPLLASLRLIRLASSESFSPPPDICSQLRTLSLGLDLESDGPVVVASPPSWQRFLAAFASMPESLPQLVRFEADQCTSSVVDFCSAHGAKIHYFRAAVWPGETDNFTQAIEHMPALRNLVVVLTSGRVVFPRRHPSLQQICIDSLVSAAHSTCYEVPDNVQEPQRQALVNVFRAVEKLDAPLEVLRLQNNGNLARFRISRTQDISNGLMLKTWAVRFKASRSCMLFCDKDGVSFFS
uniref:F-box domain-containing protein n=1 Tax=Mycena chlorophos TaxID=658473 RepID=A0ABQ0LX37_MYCCL|nr:predicted protein [Mycena chlorophos]